MIYFTADTHFFHKKMLEFRPYSSIEEMNETLIVNWNKTVRDNDDIYHLGDFSFGNLENTEPIIQKLRGRKHLILGNHDKIFRQFRTVFNEYFKEIVDYKEIKYNKNVCILMHYPILKWNRGHYGTIHLHGHSHGNLPDKGIRRFDVGVDVFDYAPVSIDEIMSLALDRPVDTYHHE